MSTNRTLRIIHAKLFSSPIVITVTPITPSVAQGNTVQMTAAATASGVPTGLPAGAWSSTDNTNVPVNATTGLVTGVASGNSASISYTTTLGSYVGSTTVTVTAANALNPTTGAYIMGSDGSVPFRWDDASIYTSDGGTATTAWKSWWGTAIQGKTDGPYALATGTNTPRKYGDGQGNASYAGWVTSMTAEATRLGLPTGAIAPVPDTPGWMCVVGNANTNAQATTPQPQAVPTAGTIPQSWIFARRMLGQVGFTAKGDGNSPAAVSYNSTQSRAIKGGPYVQSLTNGRSGAETTSWQGTTPIDTGTQDLAITGTNGNNAVPLGAAGLTGGEWTDGVWWDVEVRVKQFQGSGVWYGEIEYNKRKVGTLAWNKVGPTLVGAFSANAVLVWSELVPFVLNYNQSRSTPVYFGFTSWAMWDMSLYNDPMGSQAQNAAAAPLPPSVNTLNAQTGGSITCNVKLNQYIAYLRPYIDNVAVIGQDYAIPDISREGKIVSGVSVYNTVTPTVTGVPSGTHAITWVGLNANKSGAPSAATSPLSVTV